MFAGSRWRGSSSLPIRLTTGACIRRHAAFLPAQRPTAMVVCGRGSDRRGGTLPVRDDPTGGLSRHRHPEPCALPCSRAGTLHLLHRRSRVRRRPAIDRAAPATTPHRPRRRRARPAGARVGRPLARAAGHRARRTRAGLSGAVSGGFPAGEKKRAPGKARAVMTNGQRVQFSGPTTRPPCVLL